MSGRRIRSPARLAGIGAALALAAGSTAAAAGPGDGYRARAARLQVRAQALDSRAHHELLDLYALDSKLGAARERAAALDAQALQIAARRRVLAGELTATRRTLALARRLLGQHLRTLYEQGRVDPVAVVLGSTSLSRALTRLDDLSRVADESRQVAAVAGAAQIRLGRIGAALTAERRAVEASLAAAARAERALASARASRVAYVGSLRADSRLARARVRTLLAKASAVEAKSQQIQVAAAVPAPTSPNAAAPTTTAPAGETPAPVAAHERTLTVSATGYSLPGHTATGLPVGWGVVAVDPSVIPLGTRLTIPGYGEGFAADVGSGVQGAMIDLWFPTLSQATAWGRRTITIALH